MVIEKEFRICIVGPLPEPIGGVSSHIARLAAFLVNHGFHCTILDTYPAPKKMSTEGTDHIVMKSLRSALGIPRLLGALFWIRCDVVHLHFSQISGWFVLALLMFKRGRVFMLSLHHGDQTAMLRKASWPIRLLAVRALRRMDRIVALSQKQFDFYRSLGVPLERLVRWNAALPLNILPEPAALPEKFQDLRAVEDGGNETLLMTSGYPTESYRYEHCLELLDRLSSKTDCRLIVSLYGKGLNAGYDEALRRRLSKHPQVILVDPLPAPEFIALLAKASLYLRPSTIDSYGLVITDAIDVGTPCLASDICARDPRCETYPAADKRKFMSRAMELVERGRRERKRTPTGIVDSSTHETILRCYQRSRAA